MNNESNNLTEVGLYPVRVDMGVQTYVIGRSCDQTDVDSRSCGQTDVEISGYKSVNLERSCDQLVETGENINVQTNSRVKSEQGQKLKVEGYNDQSDKLNRDYIQDQILNNESVQFWSNSPGNCNQKNKEEDFVTKSIQKRLLQCVTIENYLVHED